MSAKIRTLLGMGLLAAAVGVASAQVSKKTTETKGTAEKKTTTQTIHGEIISVNGNDVVAKTDAGTRDYKVPDGFKFQMDGKDIGVGELQPGMKVTATITTTTTVTPVTVTEVREAEVLAVSGSTILVKGPDGNKKWTAKDAKNLGITIMKGGKEVHISEIKVGDRLTAVIVSNKPPIVEHSRSMRASAKGAPAAPAPAAAPAAAAPAPEPAPAAAAPAPAPAHKKLPKTASQVPMVGLLGALSLASGFGLSVLRRRSR